ncbi:hypothetical protein M758_UG054900 [Ceratodon purpureus]|nr:hypothetical protein M758_UG054900 [Ceratodon purpureus]
MALPHEPARTTLRRVQEGGDNRQWNPTSGYPPTSSSWYVEAQLIARSEEKYPPATEDIFFNCLKDIELKRINAEHEHKLAGLNFPFEHPQSLEEEIGLALIDKLPYTHLPPVAQVIVYMQNLAAYYEYMHEEERQNFPRFLSNPVEELCYEVIPRFLKSLPSQFGLQRDRPQVWRTIIREARDVYQHRLSGNGNYFEGGNTLAPNDGRMSINKRLEQRANNNLEVSTHLDWITAPGKKPPAYSWVDCYGKSHTVWAGPPIGFGTDEASRVEGDPYEYEVHRDGFRVSPSISPELEPHMRSTPTTTISQPVGEASAATLAIPTPHSDALTVQDRNEAPQDIQEGDTMQRKRFLHITLKDSIIEKL